MKSVCVVGFALFAFYAQHGRSQPVALESWADFDALIEKTVAGRPDLFYPPCDRTFTHETGFRTFTPADFSALTNRPPDHAAGGVPVWKVRTVETNGWFVTDSGGVLVHSNAVPAYDAEAWARSKYGSPPRWIAADPDALAEWYFLRRRDRVAMSVSLAPAERWEEYVAARLAAAAGTPPPGEPAPVPPADTNLVAFARLAAPQASALPFDVYVPADLPVDLFTKTNLAAEPLWTYAGRVSASAPFTPASLPAPGPRLFLNLARGDADSDGDGIPDGVELLAFGSNPHLADTSGGGLSDWLKVYRLALDPRTRDSDGDGYPDDEEILSGMNPSSADPGAASSVRYAYDDDGRLTAAFTGAGQGASVSALTPAGNAPVQHGRAAQ
jgi:hypothetical protein